MISLQVQVYLIVMFSRRSKISQAVLSFGIFAFLLVGFLSLSHIGMSMGMNNAMPMSHCPFMNEMAICDMSPLEHIGMWQSLFANILTPENMIFILLLLIVATLPLSRLFFSPPKDILIRIRRVPDDGWTRTPSFLEQLFSQGILNPKLF